MKRTLLVSLRQNKMTSPLSIDDILLRLSDLIVDLDSVSSIDEALTSYEAIFSLLHEGQKQLSVMSQKCELLILSSDGTLLKDPQGHPVTQHFSRK